MKSFHELENLVIDWAKDRGIIPNAQAYTQLLKAFSEMGELADAEIKSDSEAVEDAVGDVLVCLIIYCHKKKIDITSCLEIAYNIISKRTGKKLPNGVFVKD